MKRCTRCNAPLGDVAKAGRSPICEACAFDAGELVDGNREPRESMDTQQETAA